MTPYRDTSFDPPARRTRLTPSMRPALRRLASCVWVAVLVFCLFRVLGGALRALESHDDRGWWWLAGICAVVALGVFTMMQLTEEKDVDDER